MELTICGFYEFNELIKTNTKFAACFNCAKELPIEYIFTDHEEWKKTHFDLDIYKYEHPAGKFDFFHVLLEDDSAFDISKYFEIVVPLIRQYIDNKQHVVIFCGEGISRSVAISIAFYMCYYNISYDEAYKRVKDIRPIAQPNLGFCLALEAYEIK